MNFDILDSYGNQINLMCTNLIYNGTVQGSNRAWYTLSGNVTQNGGAAFRAVYQPALWRTGGHQFNPVSSVTVNPMANGDVDVYID